MLAKRGAYNIPPADKTNIIPIRKHVTSQQIRDYEPILYYVGPASKTVFQQ